MHTHTSLRARLSKVVPISLVSLSILACILPTPTPPTPKSQQAIDALGQVDSQEEAEAAISDIVRQGYSLGLVDEEGNQLNPNVSGEDVISLTPDDVAVYAMTSGGEHYRTLDHVVAYMADIGMTLESTGRPITTTDLLPDLQVYVDWCFAHPDDPKSTLGLLLAAGPELQVPDSAPQMAGNTPISPLAGMLLLADLLVGLEQEVIQVNASLPEGAHLASRRAMPPRQDKNTLTRVRGLITNIEVLANNTVLRGLASLCSKLTEEDEKTKKQLATVREYLGAVKMLIDHYEFSDHLAVRIVHPDGSRANTVTLNKTGDKVEVEGRIVAVTGKREEVLHQIPFAYTFQLVSGNRVGPGPLFKDADAVLTPPSVKEPKYVQDFEGNRLQVTTDRASYEIEARDMRNGKEETALLYGDAILPLDNIDKLLEDWKKVIDMMPTDMKPEELKQLLVTLKRDLNPLPTMSIVTFKAQEETTATATEPAQATATILPTLSFFPDDCKCPALEAAVAKVEIDEANTIRSEFLHCNYSLEGSGQSEYGGCDLTINSNSSPEATYNQFKRESEFLDSYKEDSANFKVIKEERTDDRYSLILESIPHGYCSGQRLVIYRGRSLLSMDAVVHPSPEGHLFVPCEDLLNIMEAHAKAIIDKQ
jgi:hypothetical protein